jgi:dihydrofolate synthase/folylpolyglutamate synthase
MTLLESIFTLTPPPGKQRELERMCRFVEQFNFPCHAYPCIHIAGSNGKGSVATKIAAALQASGLKVGLYTSPHLHSFCERIVINGVPIAEDVAEAGVREILDVQKKMIATETDVDLTFFEIATLLAFLHFQREQVDVAVIETGLGGRRDATNVVTPILTVITSISKEHAHLLGGDLESIAAEKAGILKSGVPVVLGPYARQTAILQRAEALHCPVYEISQTFSHYDEENQAVARQCLELLGKRFSLTSDQINQGLSVRPACRMEQQGNIIYDVAHNPDACARLVQALRARYPGKRFRFLLGFCQDKDFEACIRTLAAAATHLHFVQAKTTRAADVSALALATGELAPFTCHQSVAQAMEAAYRRASEAGELLVVTGSFYMMSEAFKASTFS